jgi:PilZ domain
MSERRTDERIEVCLEAIWDGAQRNFRARIADISEGGCYIDSIGEVSKGQLLHLELLLPMGGSLQLVGEVAYFLPRLGFGLRFVNMNQQQTSTLRELVAHLSQRNQLPGRLSA